MFSLKQIGVGIVVLIVMMIVGGILGQEKEDMLVGSVIVGGLNEWGCVYENAMYVGPADCETAGADPGCDMSEFVNNIALYTCTNGVISELNGTFVCMNNGEPCGDGATCSSGECLNGQCHMESCKEGEYCDATSGKCKKASCGNGELEQGERCEQIDNGWIQDTTCGMGQFCCDDCGSCKIACPFLDHNGEGDIPPNFGSVSRGGECGKVLCYTGCNAAVFEDCANCNGCGNPDSVESCADHCEGKPAGDPCWEDCHENKICNSTCKCSTETGGTDCVDPDGDGEGYYTENLLCVAPVGDGPSRCRVPGSGTVGGSGDGNPGGGPGGGPDSGGEEGGVMGGENGGQGGNIGGDQGGSDGEGGDDGNDDEELDECLICIREHAKKGGFPCKRDGSDCRDILPCRELCGGGDSSDGGGEGGDNGDASEPASSTSSSSSSLLSSPASSSTASSTPGSSVPASSSTPPSSDFSSSSSSTSTSNSSQSSSSSEPVSSALPSSSAPSSAVPSSSSSSELTSSVLSSSDASSTEESSSIASGTHLECVGETCTEVPGGGPDTCDIILGCGVDNRMICFLEQCALVSGGGAHECSTDIGCGKHTVCRDNACVIVEGIGKNECATSTQCITSSSSQLSQSSQSLSVVSVAITSSSSVESSSEQRSEALSSARSIIVATSSVPSTSSLSFIDMALYCGNGLLNQGEECDDGNIYDGDGCSARCIVEEDYIEVTLEESQQVLVAAASVCGNGLLETGEECDDSNARDHDGCNSTCLLEIGICGDGVVQSLLGEQCESSTHSPLLPYQCSNCRFLSTFCGNATRDPGEECDRGDLNSTSPDAYCRPDCSRSRCGDGIVDSAEMCDDGNRRSDDGCDQYCRTEVEEEEVVLSDRSYSQVYQVPLHQAPQRFQFPQFPAPQPVSYQLPLAQLQPLITQRGPVGDTGPGMVVVVTSGIAAGIGWARRQKKR